MVAIRVYGVLVAPKCCRYTNLLLLTTAAGGVVNIVLSVVKLLAGVAFNSKALLADGVHSFSDLVSDIGTYFESNVDVHEKM